MSATSATGRHRAASVFVPTVNGDSLDDHYSTCWIIGDDCGNVVVAPTVSLGEAVDCMMPELRRVWLPF